MRLFVLFLTFAGAGCGYTQLAPVPDDVGPTHVWVYKSGAWRSQHAPDGGVTSELRAQLAANGVEIVLFEEDGPWACRGSGCRPVVMLYALIPRSQLDTAKRLGFTREYGFERGLPPPGPTG
jgi:hypothetical protein